MRLTIDGIFFSWKHVLTQVKHRDVPMMRMFGEQLQHLFVVASFGHQIVQYMTSLEPLRNSQHDFSSSVTLKYIMLQSCGLRADTRSVNEVMLRRIAVIKSSVVFNL